MYIKSPFLSGDTCCNEKKMIGLNLFGLELQVHNWQCDCAHHLFISYLLNICRVLCAVAQEGRVNVAART